MKKTPILFPDKQLQLIENEAKRLGYPSVADYLLELHRTAAGAITSAKSSTNRVGGDTSVVFKTKLGQMHCGDSVDCMQQDISSDSIDLIMTSPPFGLVRKKYYGNEDADNYLDWFEQFAIEFMRILKPSGSLVIDIGGAWKPGLPTRSLYHFELLIMLCRKFGFHLAQEFYWWNPAKLPTPAEWVNIRRVRVKDAVNCVWWLSKTPYPKVSNRRVLQPYSKSMKDLLINGYQSKLRPSGHDISTKFQHDNGGAIPPNLIALANTESNGVYQRFCKEHNLPEHPARFPAGLPGFFIKMLTDKHDLVFDPFAGSGMTAAVSEQLGRRWLGCELDPAYVNGARGRFLLGSEKIFSGRSEAYEIFPPTFTNTIEEPALVHDGGAARPEKVKK